MPPTLADAGDDRAAAIAVNSSGEAYVTGVDSVGKFPFAAAAPNKFGGIAKTAFVLKLNATGNQLLFSTYLGGTNYDLGTAIAVDATGNAYVAGDTQSSDFPVIRRRSSRYRRRHRRLRQQN